MIGVRHMGATIELRHFADKHNARILEVSEQGKVKLDAEGWANPQWFEMPDKIKPGYWKYLAETWKTTPTKEEVA